MFSGLVCSKLVCLFIFADWLTKATGYYTCETEAVTWEPLCDFDGDFCQFSSYSNISNFSWVLPSNSSDPLSGDWQRSNTSGYAYLDPKMPLNTAAFLKSHLLLNNFTTICVRFYYASIGNDSNAVKVHFQTDGSTQPAILEKNTDGVWIEVDIVLCNSSGSHIVAFESEKVSENSTVALDNIWIAYASSCETTLQPIAQASSSSVLPKKSLDMIQTSYPFSSTSSNHFTLHSAMFTTSPSTTQALELSISTTPMSTSAFMTLSNTSLNVSQTLDSSSAVSTLHSTSQSPTPISLSNTSLGVIQTLYSSTAVSTFQSTSQSSMPISLSGAILSVTHTSNSFSAVSTLHSTSQSSELMILSSMTVDVIQTPYLSISISTSQSILHPATSTATTSLHLMETSTSSNSASISQWTSQPTTSITLLATTPNVILTLDSFNSDTSMSPFTSQSSASMALMTPTTATISPGKAGIIICTFETDQCGDFTGWTRVSGDQTSGYGPQTDHTWKTREGHYLYFQGNEKMVKPTVVTMHFLASLTREICVSFWYRVINGSSGSLSLTVNKRTVWINNASSDTDWISAKVNVSSGNSEYITFEVFDKNATIALDDIIVTDSRCSNFRLPQCHPETTEADLSEDIGTLKFTWEKATVGYRSYAPCLHVNISLHGYAEADRLCQLNDNGTANWGKANYSACDVIFNINLADEILIKSLSNSSAPEISSIVKNLIERFVTIAPSKTQEVLNILEQLVNVAILAQPGVLMNVMQSIDHLIDLNVQSVETSRTNNSITKRLLQVIESLPENAPLVNGTLAIVSSNMAIAAQSISPDEVRNIIMKSILKLGQDEENQINVDFSNQSVSLPVVGISIFVPLQTFIKSLEPKQRDSLSRVAFVVYQSSKLFQGGDNTSSDDETSKNATSVSERKINSHVVSASLPGVKVQGLMERVIINLSYDVLNATNPHCVFWDESILEGKGGWSEEGCVLLESYEGGTSCGCNHLTNFALLMDLYQEGSGLSSLNRQVLSAISYAGCGISTLGLILTLVSYSIIKKLKQTKPSKILINLCAALLTSNLIFLLGMQDYTFDNLASCKAVAFLLHYFLLSSLTWMAIEAFYMYLALVLVFKTHFAKFMVKCCLIGWGVPLVIVGLTVAVNSTNNYGFINSGLCWLRDPAFYISFVAPTCLILLLNCVAFGLVVRQLMHFSNNQIKNVDRIRTTTQLKGIVGVVILLGLCWLFGVFAIDQASVVFYYLFAIFNSLQGCFIFIFYCLMRPDVTNFYKEHIKSYSVNQVHTKIYKIPSDKSKSSSEGISTYQMTSSSDINTVSTSVDFQNSSTSTFNSEVDFKSIELNSISGEDNSSVSKPPPNQLPVSTFKSQFESVAVEAVSSPSSTTENSEESKHDLEQEIWSNNSISVQEMKLKSTKEAQVQDHEVKQRYIKRVKPNFKGNQSHKS